MIKPLTASLLVFAVFAATPQVTAQAPSANPCPATRAALERSLSGLTLTSTSPEAAGHFRHYDTASTRVIGVRPAKITAYFVNGKVMDLEYTLPGKNAAPYVKAFAAALAGAGSVQCDAASCSWQAPKTVSGEAKDTLARVSLSSTIFNTARLDCSYR